MTAPSLNTRQTIVQLLSNMQDGKEIRNYLQRFSSIDQSRFAVIKIGGAILAEQLRETADALAFLHTVGLTPIVIHGGGPQLDAALKERGTTVFINSHLLMEVERMCDRVVIVARGKVVREGTVDELLPDKGLVRVLVTIFGRQAPIEIEEWQIAKRDEV